MNQVKLLINNRLFASINFVSSNDVHHSNFLITKFALFFVPELILLEKNEAFPTLVFNNSTLLHRLLLYWISDSLTIFRMN